MKISPYLRLGAVAAVPVIGVLVTAEPAVAALKRADVGPVGSGAQNVCPSPYGTRGVAWVTLAGDYVTVRDSCADGRAVQGRVTMKVNGVNRTWKCTNTWGKGTTKVCNFDWPEGFVGFKTILFYSVTKSHGSTWTLGQLAHWRDG